MVRHKRFPKIQGEFVRWLNDAEFIILIDGKEIIAHKDYWEGDIPTQPEELKGE